MGIEQALDRRPFSSADIQGASSMSQVHYRPSLPWKALCVLHGIPTSSVFHIRKGDLLPQLEVSLWREWQCLDTSTSLVNGNLLVRCVVSQVFSMVASFHVGSSMQLPASHQSGPKPSSAHIPGDKKSLGDWTALPGLIRGMWAHCTR